MTSYKDTVTPSEHLLGRIKWFNNKAGYGFITVTDGVRSGSDVFVHHNAINVDNQQYKYLVQGEYVEFRLVKTESKTHEWQASNVAGIRGGKLMCETRRDLKIARNEYKSIKTDTPQTDDTPQTTEPKMPRQRAPREATSTDANDSIRQRKTYAPRVRGEGPREATTDKKDWTLVAKNSTRNVQGRPPPRQGYNSI